MVFSTPQQEILFIFKFFINSLLAGGKLRYPRIQYKFVQETTQLKPTFLGEAPRQMLHKPHKLGELCTLATLPAPIATP